ncbi:GNAT family N-acetyltransferase [Cellulomonas cellasea]|uniref:Ribosomal protein S18 acetylase RimI-like enzyme n=1 Tax=Cellulomonas cellasea TaxID=43670 RepID=A0A7W4UBG8_9CELL|nr:GNAT family N-acetyltransferase [Cellulomonas cellasea]MBB2921133.1 ribosomal protein S18 acetylase RimI-like enzyme [Cellulomonas cellasea]
MGDVRVRVATGGRELRDVGALTAEAYHADRLLSPDDDYTVELRDAERRAGEAVLLVALVPAAPGDGPVGGDGDVSADTDAGVGTERGTRSGAAPGADARAHAAGGGAHDAAPDGVVVGTVTLAPAGTSYAEVAEPGEAEIRMLAVAPEARRRGVAEALVRAALDHAVTSGHRRVVLSTFDAMRSAQRLYRRLGFVPVPARDWQHEGVHVRVHVWEAPPAPGAEVETSTWRPVEAAAVGPWRLGLSGGFTRRANSVVALGEPADVDAAIVAVEERYAAAGLPAVFRVCPASRPTDLASRLAARGYTTVSRTSVLVRPVEVPPREDDGAAAWTDEGAAAGEPGPSGRGTGEPVIAFADAPDDDWLRGWLAVKAGGGVDLGLARRVVGGAAARYATASDEHGVVGVIRAAAAGEWVGLSCLMVAERGRRRGLGRRLTELALRDAADRGATRAFLQVEEHNVGARSLYLGAGFQAAEVYEYCERRSTGAAAGAAPTGGC